MISNVFRQSEIRLEWAEKKLNELKTLIEVANQETIDFAIRESQTDGMQLVFHFQDRVHDEAIRLLSEFLHHARASLDYIVFDLARHNTSSEQDRTRFPICECSKLFEKSRKSALKFLTDEQIEVIKRVQPYNGFPVLALLNRISNRDKHREFVLAPSEGLRRLVPIEDTRGCSRGIPSDQIGMEFHLSYDVLLDDGMPVVETLKKLQTLVGKLLSQLDKLVVSIPLTAVRGPGNVPSEPLPRTDGRYSDWPLL